MMIKPKIISLGEVLWDLFPEGERFGGAPANFACHAALLGAEVTMVSAVGDDERGAKALEILKDYGIDTGFVRVVSGKSTGSVGVDLDGEGKPRYAIHENSAWDEVEWTPELGAKIASVDAVYFGTLGQRGQASRSAIRKALDVAESEGVPRVLDVNLRVPYFDDGLIRESVTAASILKMSDEELGDVAAACGVPQGDLGEETLNGLLAACHLDQIVMTRGAEGAVLVSPGEVVIQAGIPAEVADTVGAGDSFMASFILGVLRGEPSETTLLRACEKASAVCAQSGAIPPPPKGESLPVFN